MVKQKLLDVARDTLLRKHLSYCTEQNYIYWMRGLIGSIPMLPLSGAGNMSFRRRSYVKIPALGNWKTPST